MSQPMPFDTEGEIIDVGVRRRRRRGRWRWFVLAAILLIFFLSSRALSIYLSALWFGSLGYASVYWYMFKLKIELFIVFFLLTAALVRGGLWLVERAFAEFAFDRRTIFLNQQPVNFSPARVLRPLAWIVSLLAALIFAFGMRQMWRSFALYTHQVTTSLLDPIFQKPLGFYFFTLPIYDAISEWLLSISVIILVGSIVYALLAVTQQGLSTVGNVAKARRVSLSTVSYVLAV